MVTPEQECAAEIERLQSELDAWERDHPRAALDEKKARLALFSGECMDSVSRACLRKLVTEPLVDMLKGGGSFQSGGLIGRPTESMMPPWRKL